MVNLVWPCRKARGYTPMINLTIGDTDMLNNRIPVEIVGPYVVCFEATEEWTDMHHHFVTECGWTEEQYEAIAHMPWFCAEVSIWQDGENLACEYLGCCVYETAREFTEGDYYKDMRDALLDHVQRQAA